MQIVIDIDDNLYTRLFDNGDEYVADMRRACVAIRKGTPLPKEQSGDAISRQTVLDAMYELCGTGKLLKRIRGEIIRTLMQWLKP